MIEGPNPDTQGTVADLGSVSEDLMCLACGYNLRGLSRAGGCPECGLSIQHTISARQGMTKRELAALAFRVVAVWFLLRTLVEMLQFWHFMYGNWMELCLSILLVITVVGILALIWWKAEIPARMAIRSDGPISLSGTILPVQIMSVALCIIGVIYIIYAVTGCVWILEGFLFEQRQQYMRTSLLTSAMNLVIGVVLLVGAGQLSGFLIWLRTVGTRNAK